MSYRIQASEATLHHEGWKHQHQLLGGLHLLCHQQHSQNVPLLPVSQALPATAPAAGSGMPVDQPTAAPVQQSPRDSVAGNPWQNYQDTRGGPLRGIPLQRRTNPGINEQQLLRILVGQELTGANRRTRTDRDRQRDRERPGNENMHQTSLPISSAHSRSARPVTSWYHPTPQGAATSMGRVTEAVRVSASIRGAP